MCVVVGVFVPFLPTTFVLFSLCQINSSGLTNLTNSALHTTCVKDIGETRVSFPPFLSFSERSDKSFDFQSPLTCCVSVVQVVVRCMVLSACIPPTQSRVHSTGELKLSPPFRSAP